MDLYLSNRNGYSTCKPSTLLKAIKSGKYEHILLCALDEVSNTCHSRLIKNYKGKAVFWMTEKDDILFYLISIRVDDFSEVEKIVEGHGLSNKSEIKNLVYRQGEKEFRVIRPLARKNVHFYVHSKK